MRDRRARNGFDPGRGAASSAIGTSGDGERPYGSVGRRACIPVATSCRFRVRVCPRRPGAGTGRPGVDGAPEPPDFGGQMPGRHSHGVWSDGGGPVVFVAARPQTVYAGDPDRELRVDRGETLERPATPTRLLGEPDHRDH